MKRHHPRQAQLVLTLSLMGSLALLSACGGGGKGAAAAPAPAVAASVAASEPSLAAVTDPNEPYIVSPSALTTESGQNTYKLNIIDGGLQKLVKSITLTRPLDNRWKVVNRIDTKDGVDTDKGPGTVYYLNEVRKLKDPTQYGQFYQNHGGQIMMIDLTRTSDLTPKAISGVFDACWIKSTYNLTQDGSKVALIVTTAGSDGECGDPNGSKSDQDAANNNVDLVVTTDDTAGTPEIPGTAAVASVAATASAPAVPGTPEVKTIPAVPGQAGRTPAASAGKVLQYLYQAGTLTGVLTERSLTATTAQLDVLSPTLDKVLTDYTQGGKSYSGVAIMSNPDPKASTTTYSYKVDSTKPGEIGSAWIARLPGSFSTGYMRIQDTSLGNASFNYLYKFTWDAAASPVVAKLVYEPYRGLTPGSTPNTGVTGSKYIYFVNGQYLVYGPTSDSSWPFPTLTPTPFTSSQDPVTDMFETTSSIVVVQTDSAKQKHIVAINKTTGVSQQIADGYASSPLTIHGIRGDDLYITQVIDGVKRLARRSVITPTTDISSAYTLLSTTEIVLSVAVDPVISWGQSVASDSTGTLGHKELSSLVVCTPGSSIIDTCQSTTLKVFDLVSQKLAHELGPLTADDAGSITVEAPQALTSTNNVYRVTKQRGYNATQLDPWIYNVNTSNTLFRVETFK